MSNVSLQQNGYTNSLQPEIRKTTKQPEFSALDKEQIKQDAVELAQQGHEAVKENWVFSTMRNVFHIENPKKFLTSLGLTLATIVGLAFLGNKSTNKMTKLGQKVDDLLANNKLYQNTAQNLNNLKNKTVSTLRKSKTLDDVFETLKTRKATPKADLTRGYGRGFVSIFSVTPVDIIKTALNKKQAKLPQGLASQLGNKNTQKFMELFRSDPQVALDALKKITNDETKAQEIFNNLTKADNEVLNSIKKLVGENKAKTFFNQITGLNEIKDNRKFCSELTNAIIDNFNLKNSSGKVNKKALMSFFEGLQKGNYKNVDFSEFINVKMDQGNLFGAWWPVNAINSVGKKLFKGKWKEFGKGNLGDALIKFNDVNGTLADTKIGSLVQKSVLVPTESISNFVNDKSGFGVMLCASIMSLYNNVQDAPKDKKVATVADDYIGTMGSFAISTPLAFATTYGLASLKNLEGTTIKSKVLKNIGKFFGMGLDNIAKDGTIIQGTKNPIFRFAGGALRFALIMFVFSGMFSKPIKGVIHKVFGKPYDKMEEQKKAGLEAQKNTIIPELGITQGELLQKIQNNPEAVQKLQTNPELMQKLQNNPKLMVDFLDGKNVDLSSVSSKPSENENIQLQMSPYNANLINKSKTPNNQLNKNNTTETVETTKTEPIDTATYIPSSDFVAPVNQYSDEQTQKINKVMADADKALKRAEKYI